MLILAEIPLFVCLFVIYIAVYNEPTKVAFRSLWSQSSPIFLWNLMMFAVISAILQKPDKLYSKKHFFFSCAFFMSFQDKLLGTI